MDNSSDSFKNTHFISITGQIGSGKGTLAQNLATSLPDSQTISYGEIYRNAKDKKKGYERYYDVIAPFIDEVDNGMLLPDAPTFKIIQDEIKKALQEGKRNIILDGFPRTLEQLHMLEEHLGNQRIDFIDIELNDEDARERATFRMVDSIAKKGNTESTISLKDLKDVWKIIQSTQSQC